jgi:hypothetical protein
LKPLLPRHDRYDFVSLNERRDYCWPDGKRLAFLVTTNIEWFAFGAGLGNDPAKPGEPQTHRNYSWRDYGNRIGIWRLFDLLDELALPAGHCTNSLMYEYAPQITDAIRKRGDEVIAHGRSNAENLRGLWQPDEARILREVTVAIARHEGRAPAGWFGAGAYETAATPDLLQELGYRYLMDWPMDDQPVWMRTRGPDPLDSLSHRDRRCAGDHPSPLVGPDVRRRRGRPIRRNVAPVRGAAARHERLAASLRLRPAVPRAPAASRTPALRRPRGRVVLPAARHRRVLLFR